MNYEEILNEIVTFVDAREKRWEHYQLRAIKEENKEKFEKYHRYLEEAALIKFRIMDLIAQEKIPLNDKNSNVLATFKKNFEDMIKYDD